MDFPSTGQDNPVQHGPQNSSARGGMLCLFYLVLNANVRKVKLISTCCITSGTAREIIAAIPDNRISKCVDEYLGQRLKSF